MPQVQNEQPQPQAQTVINVLQNELQQSNNNRVFLISLLEDTKAEALAEIAARDSRIEALLQQIADLDGHAEPSPDTDS